MVTDHRTVTVNCALALTLGAAVVTQGPGYRWPEAVTLGRAIAGLYTYSKGISLGIFELTPESVAEQHRKVHEKLSRMLLLGRAVPVSITGEGIRAMSHDQPISVQSVQSYLDRAFGDAVEDVRVAMEEKQRAAWPGD